VNAQGRACIDWWPALSGILGTLPTGLVLDIKTSRLSTIPGFLPMLSGSAWSGRRELQGDGDLGEMPCIEASTEC
jgi:hypothetical protein